MRTACWFATGLCLVASGAWGDDIPPIGVIVAKPSGEVTDSQWGHLQRLQCMPEVLSRYSTESVDAPFDFSGLREDLAAFEAHGLEVSLTLTAHIHSTPYLPMRDEEGEVYQQRQNPFDPAFLSEWGRLHGAFLEAFGDDPRIRRVYVGPPSYFGEVEYFMGPDWSHLKFLCYGDSARAAFTAWLQDRYATPEALSAAWDVEVPSWDDWAMPLPRRDAAGLHLDTQWLDLMRWRTDHLTEIVATEMARLARGFHGEVGLKAAIGDFSAAHGVNTADIVARFTHQGKLAMHATNGHSLADLRHYAAIGDHYGANSLTIENDGNRFTRTELARILLNYHLSGADTFNFAHLGHFNLEPPTRSTSETVRVLRSLRPWITRYELDRRRRDIAFLHSNTTAWIRGPHYRNRDVSRVYDTALSNGEGPQVRAYSWGRWLGLPDVTCDRLVLDGDLAGRRMLVIPNSGTTVMPEEVRNHILAWVREGGALVLFGEDAFGRVLEDTPTRCTTLADWRFPEVTKATGTLTRVGSAPVAAPEGTHTFPVFSESPDEPWEPVLAADSGPIALARRALGRGTLYLFPGAVPESRDGPFERFHAEAVPAMLRDIAGSAGVVFDLETTCEGRAVSPLALGYLGVDGKSGHHVFVGGAYDGSVPRFTLVPRTDLTGPAELLLVDEDRVAVTAARGEVSVSCNRPAPAKVYADPTNTEERLGAYVPCTTIRFELPNELQIALAPE